MPDKDYRRYLAVIGELLKRYALDCRAEALAGDRFREGMLLGWAHALSVMRDALEPFGLAAPDLAWEDFVPERDLLGARPKR